MFLYPYKNLIDTVNLSAVLVLHLGVGGRAPTLIAATTALLRIIATMTSNSSMVPATVRGVRCSFGGLKPGHMLCARSSFHDAHVAILGLSGVKNTRPPGGACCQSNGTITALPLVVSFLHDRRRCVRWWFEDQVSMANLASSPPTPPSTLF